MNENFFWSDESRELNNVINRIDLFRFDFDQFRFDLGDYSFLAEDIYNFLKMIKILEENSNVFKDMIKRKLKVLLIPIISRALKIETKKTIKRFLLKVRDDIWKILITKNYLIELDTNNTLRECLRTGFEFI